MRSCLVIALTLVACHRKPAPPPGPRGDCEAAAEMFASYELGNYAEPDARAPVIAKYKDACEDAGMTASEVACVKAAADTWSAKACATRAFPELADNHDDGSCKKLVDRERESLGKQIDPALQAWASQELDIEQTACLEDGWPDVVVACMLSGSGAPCKFGLPAPLQKKLQARLQTAFADLAK